MFLPSRLCLFIPPPLRTGVKTQVSIYGFDPEHRLYCYVALGGGGVLKKHRLYVFPQEAEGSLANVLKENADKMQLTRRILDLKQVRRH